MVKEDGLPLGLGFGLAMNENAIDYKSIPFDRFGTPAV